VQLARSIAEGNDESAHRLAATAEVMAKEHTVEQLARAALVEALKAAGYDDASSATTLANASLAE
jgi:hypothetical protein